MKADAHLVPCAGCGTLNRVPAQRLGDDPVCGRCSAGLLTGEPVELADADFEAYVSRSGLPVLVDFWAPWCGPCRMMAPAFAEAAAALKGRAVLVKVNSDAAPHTSARFGIRSIPTLVRLDGGRETQRRTGALPAAAIRAMASS
jgi:thioredoxin 2